MVNSPVSSPRSHRFQFSRDGFERLNPHANAPKAPTLDATIDIPMQDNPSHGAGSPSNEKSGIFHRNAGGYRRSMKPGVREAPKGRIGYDEEESTLTKMGEFYTTFLNFSTFTRYLVYVVPIGLLIAVPIIIGATAAQNAAIGGISMTWFFVWVEVAWCGLWVSKIFAHYLPRIFQSLVGVVSSGTRKYALVIAALELPLSLAGWALVSLASFVPIMLRNPESRAANLGEPHWVTIVNRILAAALVASLVFLVEKFFVQLISINYHRKQFTTRIKESKRNIYLLSLLYDASRAMFPQGCPEFSEEDAVIEDSFEMKFGGGSKHSHQRSGSHTPIAMLRGIGEMGQNFLSGIAKDVTGKTVFDGSSAHAVVMEALEKNRTAEALARRLWLSFVIEGNDALFLEDVNEVLGTGRNVEAEECFVALDRDLNGDVSLDEMILTVSEIGRDRHAINNSMHDVDQAIKVLDRLLCTVVLVAIVFIVVAFLNTSFVTTLATAGTALLSLSFVFSATAQEVLGSCIFLFVKHPFDIGDRVDLSDEKLVVEHISLLFTVFRRVTNHQTVQIPNILLNGVWIENVSRSRAMREQITVPVDFGTTFEDIQLLRAELQKFILDKDNSRDFMPDVDIQVVGIADMDKLSLSVEIVHKSNWSNETVRASRRSKLMCALVLALRKVPIAGPKGSAATLGSSDNPQYSVSVSDREAAQFRKDYASGQETKRMMPTTKAPETKNSGLTHAEEQKAVDLINERNPALDGARDASDVYRDQSRSGAPQSSEIEEVRNVLRRETTKGRRKSGRTLSTKSVSSVHSQWTQAGEPASDPGPVPQVPSIPVNTVGTGGVNNPMAAYYSSQRDPTRSGGSQPQREPTLPQATYPRPPPSNAQGGPRQW
ncbi:hypothetical protein FH972_021814 [Carpinus fangiana]|uniref:EF-hand domain-containing protein n=1 Tax=Carpinus fangiana TaxID=176857 RepID=A0A5N6KQS0_9ROSI|nr:hypothetical protein FH972_021814 [Carpinus fangiana]